MKNYSIRLFIKFIIYMKIYDIKIELRSNETSKSDYYSIYIVV